MKSPFVSGLVTGVMSGIIGTLFVVFFIMNGHTPVAVTWITPTPFAQTVIQQPGVYDWYTGDYIRSQPDLQVDEWLAALKNQPTEGQAIAWLEKKMGDSGRYDVRENNTSPPLSIFIAKTPQDYHLWGSGCLQPPYTNAQTARLFVNVCQPGIVVTVPDNGSVLKLDAVPQCGMFPEPPAWCR